MSSVDLSRRLHPGTRLGHYVIGEWIGAGGTADLYDCETENRGHSGPARFVAKVFRFEGDTGGYNRRVRLFRKEVETLASLGGNIHIISVLESGEYSDSSDSDLSRPFCILPKLDGGTLSSRIAQRPLGAEEACNIAFGLTDALSYAHSRGVLHCDVKPDNVMLDSSANPVWIDFGIAKEMDLGDDAVSVISEIGTVATGTAPYMSPEHFEGRHALSPQSDVWSMGVLLVRMLTAEFPFGKNFTQVRQRITGRSWESIQDLPAFSTSDIPVGIANPLQQIILNCLQVNLDDRYQSAKELEDDLRAFLRAKPLVHARVGYASKSGNAASVGTVGAEPAETGPPPIPKRNWVAPGVVGGLFALLVSFLVFRNVINSASPDNTRTIGVDSSSSSRTVGEAEPLPLTSVDSGQSDQTDDENPESGTAETENDSTLVTTAPGVLTSIAVTLVPNTGYNPEKVIINGQNVHPNQGLLKRFEAFAGQRFTWEIETTDGLTVRNEIVLPEGRGEIKIDWLSASILDT